MAGRAGGQPSLFFTTMNFCETITVFLAATGETIQRIQVDRARAPERCHRPLEYIERRLFDPGLSITGLLKACAIKDRAFSTYFRDEIGVGPARYIETRRIEVAEKLVRETTIGLDWIRGLLGYASLKVFSNAFYRQSGCRPLAYRKRCRAPVSKLIKSKRSSLLVEINELKKILDGRLDPADADRMIRKIFKLYPDLEAPEKPSRIVGRSFYL